MSTKTNFKRVALVAVAALGLGVLSSAPSQSAVVGTLAITASNGTATTALIDSTTAGSIKVRWNAGVATDTVGISTTLNSKPTLATSSPSLTFYPTDTLTSISAATLFPVSKTAPTGKAIVGGSTGVQDTAVITAVAAGYASGTFAFQLDTTVGIVAGTYTYTLVIAPNTTTALGGPETTKTVTQDVSIVVSALAASSTVAASTYSTAVLGSTSIDSSSVTDSTTTSFAATASATAAGAIFVKLRNVSNGETEVLDSLTVTIDKGNVGTVAAGSLGKSIVVAYAPTSPAGGMQVRFYPDGSTGTATIKIATINAGTFTKTITWYGTTPTSIVAGGRLSVIAVGAETAASSNAVRAQAFDSGGQNLASSMALYAYSSDTTVISTYGAACGATAVSSSDGLWYTYCPLTGVKAGTATITIRDAATVATSTIASNAVSVRVSQGVATSVGLKTDKASYLPGEKGFVIVTVLDAAGLVMPKQSSTTTLAAGGVYTNSQLGNSSDTMTATAFATDRSSSSATAPSSNDPIKYYMFYAPTQGGSVTFTAKGATTFSAASQATGASVTVTVTDNAAAALAAVTALATTVASLKTLITTLTNLVLKIQKKVKA